MHSAYIPKPNGYDIEWRLLEADAAKARLVDPKAFGAAPVGNAHGWTHQARLLGSGLYRIELTQGHFYRFSSSNEWKFNLTVYDAAGYQLYAGVGELDRVRPLDDPLAYELLALRDAAAFVKVEATGGATSTLVDLLVETTGASIGGDAPRQSDLATQGQGSGAAQAHAAFFGGAGADRVIGKPRAPNTIVGGTGDDVIELKTAAKTLSRVDGGLARDTLIVGFPSSAARLTRINAYGPYRHLEPNGSKHDAHALSGSPDGAIIIVRSIEQVVFSDRTVEFKDLPGY
ncbi:hypothetical protein [Roseateles sp.]|uniref:hypothetical protein n=1 Tax=Roseateles sp. TaxID=1971397 RepID=UPI003919D64E